MKKLSLILLLLLSLGLCSCACHPARPLNSKVTEPATPKYSVTAEERELFARLVYCEANTEGIECQRAVVSVVFNQLDSGKWGNTVTEVIYYRNNFTPAVFGLLDTAEPTSTNYEVVDYVIQNGSTLPTYVRYFRSGYHHQWEGYEGYCVIDNVYFGFFTDWELGVW